MATIGSNRVLFADVPFQETNAMFAPVPWLFNVHFEGARLVPEDDVICTEPRAIPSEVNDMSVRSPLSSVPVQLPTIESRLIGAAAAKELSLEEKAGHI